MYTYIKQSVKGYYLELEKKLSKDLYDNLGTKWEDFLDNKWVLLNKKQVTFHTENPTASISEVWNMKLEEKERTLEQAKSEKLTQITLYDNSTEINGFTINNTITTWFTQLERLNYQRSVEAALDVDTSSTLSFFIGNDIFNVSAIAAKQMLSVIQLYADECFIVTKQHKITVNNLTTVEEVDNYDYKSGYPEKPNFNL